MDLTTLSETRRNAEALRVADEEGQAPFDLVRGPLLRTTLLRLAAEEHVLLLTLHHIICDGWSLSLLYEELAALYQAISAGQPSPLPDLPIQYADFALWQQEWLQGEELAAHLEYWKQRLAGAPAALELPTDRPRPSIPTTQGSTFVITLPTELGAALKTLSRQEGVTLFTTLIAAFQALLHRYSAQDDMVLGIFSAGRTQAETEALLGFFVNTLVLRTDLSGNPTFRDLLSRAREVILEAYAHQVVPFDYLVRELHPTRSLGQNPLFQVAYVPLDPTYPSGRLAFMLEDAQAPLVLTQQRLIEKLPGCEAEVVCLDTTWAAVAQENTEDPDSGATGENLAYLLYTSGSTGNPKGVLGTHRATINRLWWMWQSYPFDLGEVCCQRTSLSFVDSVWEIFGPLLQGVPTVIVPDLSAKDPQQMLQTLAAHAVTRIVVVPSLLQVLLDALDYAQTELPSLRYCISSGETLPMDLAQRFARAMPHSVLLNLYGSSEVAADVTSYDTRAIRADETHAAIPIGRPIANTQIYLLDRYSQLVPVGVAGELHAGGDGLARGYFNRPELTAERFIPHPFSAVPGARLYNTGDLARYRADGNIELVGRLDYQVKIRGMRVELGEPEAVLAQHHAVHQAVVTARDDTPGGKRLVAYVVLQPGDATTTSDLRGYVKAKLPDYMAPSAFVILETLPLTPNGKVDRRALPVPEDGGSELETFVAPRTPLEELVAGCWAQVLGVQRVGIHDDFFDLGGHSLVAMQVISRLRTMAQVEVPLRSYFEAPTVEQLAEVVGRLKDQGNMRKMPAIRARPRDAYRVPASALPAIQPSVEPWAAPPQE